jgi:beta-lactamase regulating signal transducer with metallopeptidase domain
MEQLSHIFTLFSATAAGSLVGAIWEGTVLAAGVALCLHFVKGIPAGVRSMLWTAVLLLVVLLHFLPLFAHKLTQQTAAAGAIHADLRWSVAIVCLWVILSAIRAAQLIHSAIGLRRVAGRATQVAATPQIAALLRTRFRTARLCTSADIDRPSVIGFFAPRVLIPQPLFAKLSPSELEQIVMHEMEHLRRADDWTNLLQKISLLLFPLNPVLLWVERRLCVERELACDDRVLHLTRARKAYATCLVNLAEHSMLRRSALLVLGAWERQSELGQRVRRILGAPEGVMGRRRMKLVTSALVLGLVGGAATLAREPQLVSFAPLPSPQVEADLLSPASTGARLVPATFRTGSEIQRNETPRVIQTVYHEPVPAPVAPQKKPHHRKPSHPALVNTATAPPRIQPQAPPQRAWVVLTNWTDSPLPSRLRLVVSGDAPSSYAAVPLPNGWLIVQL